VTLATGLAVQAFIFGRSIGLKSIEDLLRAP